jgi:hypothetical protein
VSGSATRVAGAIVLYDFDEGVDATVHDVSVIGAPLDLTVSDMGAVSWLPGGGLSVDSPVVIGSGVAADKVIGAVQASQEITIEAWVTPADTVQFGPARIAALSLNGYPGGGNFVLGQSASSYETRLRTTATNQYGIPSLASPAGTLTTTLTHVVYTRDDTGATTLYVDGFLEATGAVGGSFASWGNYVLTLANEPTGDRAWLGELHLVAVYDWALSQAQAQQNHAAGPDVP